MKPLAERLFNIAGVTGVFFGSDFISVTKADGEWQQLKPAILGAIMEHFMSDAPVLRGAQDEAAAGADEFFAAEDSETVATIKELLETRVRPKGACSGCPSSTATLRHGIQNLLKHYVPDVVEVRPMAG